MKARVKLAAAILGASLLATAPAMAQSGPKEDAGTAFGAILGGVIGSQVGGNIGSSIVGGLVGAAVGGLIGNAIGAELDAQDAASMERITRTTLETGKPRKFANKKTGVQGQARVVKTSRGSGGEVCRSVEQTVVTGDGSKTRDTVKACKGPNGWSSAF